MIELWNLIRELTIWIKEHNNSISEPLFQTENTLIWLITELNNSIKDLSNWECCIREFLNWIRELHIWIREANN